MELSKDEIRLLLLFQQKLGLNATKTADKICEVFGDGIFSGMYSKRMIFKVSRQKNEGLADKLKSGRPIEVDHQEINKNLNACQRVWLPPLKSCGDPS